jgi:hypothetical protein
MDQMIELFNDGNISKNNVKLINKLLFLKEVEIIERRNVVKETL